MKNFLKLVVLLVFLSASLSTIGQMAVVEYMRVKPDMVGKYIEVEKAWKKIHEARLKAGLIINWALYQPIFSGADDPYQFVVVTLYKGLEAYEMGWSDSIAKIAYPEYSDKDWETFFEKTSESRVLGQVLVYHLVTEANAKSLKPVKYLQVSNMSVKPGSEDAYIKLEKDYFKPMHEAAIKGGQMEEWSIWEKYPGDYTQTQYTAVNEYSSLSQMDALDYQKIFKKVFPAMNVNDLVTKTNKARTLVQSAIWRMLDQVSAN